MPIMAKKKVYPNFMSSLQPMRRSFSTPDISKKVEEVEGEKEAVMGLTVWKKSLLLNCKGFTVFDATGNLVFRVDNYVPANKSGEVLLMDAVGKPLLTIRRKKMSWGDKWVVYEGEATSNSNPKYSVQKQTNLLVSTNWNKTTSLANVSSLSSPSPSNKSKEKSCSPRKNPENIIYHMEGSYAQRRVTVYDKKRQCVAQVKRKEGAGGVLLGGDVFRLLILRPDDIHTALAMALVILLDQMFGSA